MDLYRGPIKMATPITVPLKAMVLPCTPSKGRPQAVLVKDHVLDLWGHTGEAYGLLAGVFVVPGTQNGFLYIMNGEAIAEDDDPRSAGAYSGNYIWEEKIMDAICRHLYFGE